MTDCLDPKKAKTLAEQVVAVTPELLKGLDDPGVTAMMDNLAKAAQCPAHKKGQGRNK